MPPSSIVLVYIPISVLIDRFSLIVVIVVVVFLVWFVSFIVSRRRRPHQWHSYWQSAASNIDKTESMAMALNVFARHPLAGVCVLYAIAACVTNRTRTGQQKVGIDLDKKNHVRHPEWRKYRGASVALTLWVIALVFFSSFFSACSSTVNDSLSVSVGLREPNNKQWDEPHCVCCGQNLKASNVTNKTKKCREKYMTIN